MKTRFARLGASLACLFLLMTMSSSALAVGQNRLKKTESHKFTLYNAPKGEADPYSVQYPIHLDEPGMITVEVEVGGGKLTGKKPLRIWIVQEEGTRNTTTNKINKKYIKKSEFFKTKGTASYPVDSYELKRTQGKYVIFLSNLSRESHGVGTITISYPARTASHSAASSAHAGREGARASSEQPQPRQRSKRKE